MGPVPEHPTVIIRLNNDGGIVQIATNVSRQMVVVVTQDQDTFDKAASGQPFRLSKAHHGPVIEVPLTESADRRQ
jgi:hypothetical protein